MNLFDRRKDTVMRGNVKLAIRFASLFGPDASVEFMVDRFIPNHVMLRVLNSIA